MKTETTSMPSSAGAPAEEIRPTGSSPEGKSGFDSRTGTPQTTPLPPSRRRHFPLMFPAEVALARLKQEIATCLPWQQEFKERSLKILNILDEAKELTSDLLEDYLCPKP